MNSKILIISVALAVLIAAAAFIQNYLSEPQEEGTSLAPEEETVSESEEEGQEPLEETLLQKEGFKITLPPGWQEEQNPPYTNVLLMAYDAQEEIVDSELGFRTNLTVKRDDQSTYDKTYSVREYVDSVKESLIQTVAGIEFEYEDEKTINGNNTVLLECASSQNNGDFSTLLVFVEESETSHIWTLSFNTYQNSWPDYRNLFHYMTESFKTENAI